MYRWSRFLFLTLRPEILPLGVDPRLENISREGEYWIPAILLFSCVRAIQSRIRLYSPTRINLSFWGIVTSSLNVLIWKFSMPMQAVQSPAYRADHPLAIWLSLASVLYTRRQELWSSAVGFYLIPQIEVGNWTEFETQGNYFRQFLSISLSLVTCNICLFDEMDTNIPIASDIYRTDEICLQHKTCRTTLPAIKDHIKAHQASRSGYSSDVEILRRHRRTQARQQAWLFSSLPNENRPSRWDGSSEY